MLGHLKKPISLREFVGEQAAAKSSGQKITVKAAMAVMDQWRAATQPRARPKVAAPPPRPR